MDKIKYTYKWSSKIKALTTRQTTIRHVLNLDQLMIYIPLKICLH